MMLRRQIKGEKKMSEELTYNLVLYDLEGNVVFQGNYMPDLIEEAEVLLPPSGFIDKPINDYTPTEAYLFGIFVFIVVACVIKLFSK